MDRGRLFVLLEAFFVTFLWSSSYVLVKIGLIQLSPLTLVSLRYIVASLILIFLAFLRGELNLLKDKNILVKLFFLGFLGYTIAQGLQCVGLFYLPAVSVTFILNFTPIIVLVLGVIFLREYPTVHQLAGMVMVMVGAFLFFNDPLANSSIIGVFITLLSGFGWAAYLVFSKLLFIKDKVKPLELTAFSMSFGTLFMTIEAYSFERFPVISLSGWGIIIWLGVVNTAIAFLMWNHALQKLEAFEISILQNTMLIQITLLSWLFLGENLTYMKLVSMALVFIGVLIVQLKKL
jgi:drug/metabolite transporter (DMT)-like permease